MQFQIIFCNSAKDLVAGLVRTKIAVIKYSSYKSFEAKINRILMRKPFT